MNSTNRAEENVGHVFHFFSELLKRPVRQEGAPEPIGRVSDLVFKLAEPFPEAVGIYMRYRLGRKPPQFVPWEAVVRIDAEAIVVRRPAGGDFPPFVDQVGWIMVEQHLMGRTILEMDGRKTEVVNDVHLLEVKGKLFLVHVDGSLNGILRRWGLQRFARAHPDDLISWKFVQPFSVEDAAATDEVVLSVTRDELTELPGEDLADALEELSGEEQRALFSALDSEKAAETLVEAEPRAQRQLIANLRKERARGIFTEMSVPQIADVFSILPHDHQEEFLAVLPHEQAARVRAILANREIVAGSLMSGEFVGLPAATTVGEARTQLRGSGRDPGALSYLYILEEDGRTLAGVVDLRQLVLENDDVPLGEIMASPAVTVSIADTREDLVELFARYHFRMLPVVDEYDRILGVIRYHEIIKGVSARHRG